MLCTHVLIFTVDNLSVFTYYWYNATHVSHQVLFKNNLFFINIIYKVVEHICHKQFCRINIQNTIKFVLRIKVSSFREIW